MRCMAVAWEDFQGRRSAQPVYVQLADWIAARIETGDIQPGEQLPAQRDLADITGHSPETIKNAYRVLRERELAESSNIGTFVKEN
jgi:DNA-binding transcriptional regulator YhcF (GntR family)